MKRMTWATAIVAAAVVVGCTNMTPQQQGTMSGGVAGGVAGNIRGGRQ